MDLDKRMKKYEKVTRQTMTYRMPLIMRIDGRHFHSYDFEKPFDIYLNGAMTDSAKAVCKDIAGAKFAYVQSDEASILITTYDSLDFEPHFGNRVQKLVSTASSLFTLQFRDSYFPLKDATFDARIFPIPKKEVCNYFIWRQKDWERNSIHMLARSYFSHKELHGLSCDEIQEKLWQEEKINWSDLASWKKNGTVIVKESKEKYVGEIDECVETEEWARDSEVPQFTQDRDYINQHVFLEED